MRVRETTQASRTSTEHEMCDDGQRYESGEARGGETEFFTDAPGDGCIGKITEGKTMDNAVEDEEVSPYDVGYGARIAGAELDESLCDGWVAGWYDADSNLRYEAENPLPN